MLQQPGSDKSLHLRKAALVAVLLSVVVFSSCSREVTATPAAAPVPVAAATAIQKEDAIVIPSPAVQTGQQGQFVFVIQPGMTAEPRAVTVDTTRNGESVISSGLQPGERVVIDGQLRLKPGTKVQLKPEPGSGGQNG